ncbi:MAG: CAP domain-containing protein [Actinobacteria bacterium]|nr:CAP domain-containing protein [Actinomycetota bacterium]
MKRWRLRLLLLAAGVFGMWLLGSGAAWAQSSHESCFVSKINAARSTPLTVRSDLVAIARRHSQRMASSGTIFHNGNLANEAPSDWQSLGENVGMGPSCSDIHTAFMNSPSHRKNILDPKFNFVGVGVVTASDGTLYVTEVFMEASQPAPSQPAPTSSTSGSTTTTKKSSTPRTRTTAPRPRAQAPAAPEPPPPPPPPPPGASVKGNTLAMIDQITFPSGLPEEMKASYEGLRKAKAEELNALQRKTAAEEERRRGLFSKVASYLGGVLAGSI